MANEEKETPEERMARLQKMREEQARDQTMAGGADLIVGLWRSVYENLLIRGFKEPEAMLLLQTYIVSMGNGNKEPPSNA